MWTVDRTKKPPAVLTNAWQDSGRPSSLFECLGVRVSCVSWNPQIRRICISGTLFLFYALWFFQYAVIVSDYSCFSALCAKIPHFSAGFLSASFLSMQVGPSDRTWTCGLLTPSQARYQTSPHPDKYHNPWTSCILPYQKRKSKREIKIFQGIYKFWKNWYFKSDSLPFITVGCLVDSRKRGRSCHAWWHNPL